MVLDNKDKLSNKKTMEDLKMTDQRKKDLLNEYIMGLSDDDKMMLHNEVMQEISYNDDEIFFNDDEFFEMFFNGKVLEAVRSVSYGDYNYNHDYVRFNGYGNLESFDGYDLDSHILYDEIIDYMIENDDFSILENYCNIDDLLEELEAEAEE
jgi:hypothetical protein